MGLLSDDSEPVCDHEQYQNNGSDHVMAHLLKQEDLFYQVYSRSTEQGEYWSETDGVYIKLDLHEKKFICKQCGKEFVYQTAEQVGGPDGIIRKADGRPPEDVHSGAWRRSGNWYEDNREQIEDKYHD